MLKFLYATIVCFLVSQTVVAQLPPPPDEKQKIAFDKIASATSYYTQCSLNYDFVYTEFQFVGEYRDKTKKSYDTIAPKVTDEDELLLLADALVELNLATVDLLNCLNNGPAPDAGLPYAKTTLDNQLWWRDSAQAWYDMKNYDKAIDYANESIYWGNNLIVGTETTLDRVEGLINSANQRLKKANEILAYFYSA